MTGLPPSVRIGPFDYKVLRAKSIKTEKGGDAWGMFDSYNATIHLLAKMPSKTHEQETFLHELLHGLFHHHGLDDKSSEEKVVTQLATGLIMFIRANPWFLDWLKE